MRRSFFAITCFHAVSKQRFGTKTVIPMKTTLRILILILASPLILHSQITTPVIRANFGVDADLRSNFFNGLVQSGNDDWFSLPGSVGTGQFVIDTTGSAAIVARYATDMAFRRLPFFRTMRYPQYSVINNRLLLDAVMIRDYHGDDSTVFASGGNKNGDSPADWSCPVSQGIPDKNDILDMFVHVRRAGPNATDSLWMFAGLSLDNTTGNRYVDFEMYQTDIYYDRASQQFYGYGPDAGHTAWLFDAGGNVIRPGDIIFTAEYQSASLTNIEARIWVHSSQLAMTPAGFDWSGLYDGAYNGAPYGYASIQPKVAGTYYTGLQCGNNTWGGPFGIILQNDSYVTAYAARQFVEFSVNLTKLGLDPVTLLGGNACGMPFRRILVKTRASASFTAELKDFVGPFDFFLAPRAQLVTETPYICDTGGAVARICVSNAVATSIYEWTTPNGHIVGSTTGTCIDVDTPGVYIVTQYLQANCSAYAKDTLEIFAFPEGCELLARNLYDFTGTFNNQSARLNWKVLFNRVVNYFDVERSTDGINFIPIGRVEAQPMPGEGGQYSYTDPVGELAGRTLYYRVKLQETGTKYHYSPIIRMSLRTGTTNSVTIVPNPVRDVMQLQVNAVSSGNVEMSIYDPMGKLIKNIRTQVQRGYNVITLNDLADQPRGIYHAIVVVGDEQFSEKILLIR